MKRELRSRLREALKEKSAPQESQEHLAATIGAVRVEYKNHKRRERIRYPEFLLGQVRFIGASVWLAQGAALLFVLLLMGIGLIGDEADLRLHRLPPLLGCFAIAIVMPGAFLIGRSMKHRMLETELATRMSFRRLLLARILLVGAGSLLMLGVALLMTTALTELSAGAAAPYLLLPYMVALCGGILLQVHARGRFPDFLHAAFCALSVAILLVLYKAVPEVYEPASLGVWMALCAVLLPSLIAALCSLLKKANSPDLPAEA